MLEPTQIIPRTDQTAVAKSQIKTNSTAQNRREKKAVEKQSEVKAVEPKVIEQEIEPNTVIEEAPTATLSDLIGLLDSG